jgi:hypothetical protein
LVAVLDVPIDGVDGGNPLGEFERNLLGTELALEVFERVDDGA